MSATADTARDDLAYIRALVGGEGADPTFGLTYFWGGLIYGLQVVASGLQLLGLVSYSAFWNATINLGPNLVFLVAIAVIFIRVRRRAKPAGTVGKAVNAMFGTLGASNGVLLICVAAVAIQQHSIQTWLLYGCGVFVLQGAAWMVAWVLRRRIWLAVVGAGWFVTAIAMAFSVFQIGLYVLITGLGLFGLMMVPGLIMMRLNARAA